MKILYFAWLRTQIGCSEETIDLPQEAKTVGDVLSFLETKGDAYKNALGGDKVIRVAINQDYADLDQPVTNQDELAIFPPVTGG
mgnify:CR=1 FL=1